MKYFFLFCFTTCICISVFSQRSGLMESPYGLSVDFKEGYYYTYSNTIVKGLISVDCDYIYFKSAMGEKRVVLTTKDLKAFVIGKDSFAVITKFYGAYDKYYDASFALVIKTGKLNLYSHCSHWKNAPVYISQPNQGPPNVHNPKTYYGPNDPSKERSESISVECFYYLQKDNYLYRLKRSDFKDKANFMFGDNAALMMKINKKELGFNDLEQIVAEYNAWFEQKDSVSSPAE